jgi:hypothetical protein
MPQPEQLKQKKNIINQQNIKRKNIRRTRINIQEKYPQSKFLPVRRNRIALQNVPLKEDTSRYQEKTQTKFKYPAETTSNAAKIPRQMPLFIKTISAAQITDNPRNITETTTTQRK